MCDEIADWFGAVLSPEREYPTVKPHGRLAWSYKIDPPFCESQGKCFSFGGPYFDISVMPRITPAQNGETDGTPCDAASSMVV